MWKWSALIVFGALATACSSFSAANTGGEDAGEPDDASPADVADAPDAPDAADAAESADSEVPVNILVNGDFEDGCAGWNGTNVSLTRESIDVHAGKSACRVCASGDGGYTLTQIVAKPIADGSQIVAAAWVKLPDDQTVSRTVSMTIAAGIPNDIYDVTASAGPALSKAGYLEVDGILPIDKPGVTQVTLAFGTGPSAQSGECFLIDDASVVVTP